jgi:hypothetical protein
MMSYKILMHSAAYQKAEAYRIELASMGLNRSGLFLGHELLGKDIENLDTESFIEHLVATKPPLIFAESAVYGNGKDWNQTELSILGDIGVATSVEVYDDGKHDNPDLHKTPFSATLLFIPGALLRNGTGNIPADWDEVTQDGQINPTAYQALYERRLLPLLHYANNQVKVEGKKALITIPGLGCGQFAGPFAGQMGLHLKNALSALLQKHASQLPYIKVVYYDPFRECQNERSEFGAISYLVRPFMQGNQNKPQLCVPAHYAEGGDNYSDCLLYSVVAWDHVSWPGNDFYGGSRATDDGVKAAATNSMAVMTGVEGQYNQVTHQYDPPVVYRNWASVVRQNKLRMTVRHNLCVLGE